MKALIVQEFIEQARLWQQPMKDKFILLFLFRVAVMFTVLLLSKSSLS
jgi:hypothetical protein